MVGAQQQPEAATDTYSAAAAAAATQLVGGLAKPPITLTHKGCPFNTQH